jgi:hypothetical protein
MGMDDQSKANVDTEVLKLMLEQIPPQEIDDVEGGGEQENRMNGGGVGDGPPPDNETPIARILRLNAEAHGVELITNQLQM